MLVSSWIYESRYISPASDERRLASLRKIPHHAGNLSSVSILKLQSNYILTRMILIYSMHATVVI